MIQVCIVDDHTMMREGIKKILSDIPSFQVVDETGTALELLDKLPDSTWDILILDMSLPDRNGIEVLKILKKEKPKLPVLILTMHDEDQYGFRAFKAGACGYITKDSPPENLLLAVEKVAKGEKYISPSLAEKLVSMIGTKDSHLGYESLSDREFEVLALIGTGLSISEIAAQLSLSVKTISTYRTRLLTKLGFSNNSDIIHYCIQNELIPA